MPYDDQDKADKNWEESFFNFKNNFIVSSFPDSLFHEGQVVKFKKKAWQQENMNTRWYLVIGYHFGRRKGVRYLLLKQLEQINNEGELLTFWVKESDLEFVEL